jgi:hypothetical protein
MVGNFTAGVYGLLILGMRNKETDDAMQLSLCSNGRKHNEAEFMRNYLTKILLEIKSLKRLMIAPRPIYLNPSGTSIYIIAHQTRSCELDQFSVY